MSDKKYTKQELIDQIKKLYKEIGRLPCKKDIDECSYCASWSCLKNNLGRIKEIYKYAELEVPLWYDCNNEEIIRLHVDEDLGIKELSTLSGFSYGHIYKILKNHGVKRDFRNEILIDEEQHQIIDGILVSDGYLANRSQKSCSLAIGQKSDRLNFIQYLAKQLKLEHSIYLIEPKDHWKAKVINDEYRYVSRTYLFLKEYEKRWYPIDEKIIPLDFKITPLSLLYWYIGDGSLKLKDNTIRLSTCCFPLEDLYRIIKEFENLGLHCYLSNRKEIYFRKQSTPDFFNFIKECPVKCFEYKWPKVPVKLGHRITEKEKKEIINLYTKMDYTTENIGRLYGYSKVAIARLLRLSLSKEEFKNLKKIRLINRKCGSSFFM